jgi:oligoribonuclease NrnB/cAMP/cGMP phosphodiesterase (DHH superfamily)
LKNVDNRECLVLYHANCTDGFAAAYIAREALDKSAIRKHSPKTVYKAVNYHQPPPYDLMKAGMNVYILDFSYPEQEILWMIAVKKVNVILLDHHVPTFKKLTNLIKMYEDMDPMITRNLYMKLDGDQSGAMLTYQHFFGDELEAEDFDVMLYSTAMFVDDRDRWQFQCEGTREFFQNLTSYPRNFEVWDTLHNEFRSSKEVLRDFINVEGVAQLRMFNNYIDQLLEKPLVIGEIDGLTVAMVSCDVFFSSELGNRLCAKYDAAILYSHDATTGKYLLSLRSRGEKDVEVIARKYFNGGGHKNASGGNTTQHVFWSDSNGSNFILNKRVGYFGKHDEAERRPSRASDRS